MDARPLDNLDELKAAADWSAARLSRTVQAVAGPTVVFKADVDTEGERSEAAIRQAGDGIALERGGVVALRLEVSLWLMPDHQARYLKVRSSRFRLFPEGGTNRCFATSSRPSWRRLVIFRRPTFSSTATTRNWRR